MDFIQLSFCFWSKHEKEVFIKGDLSSVWLLTDEIETVLSLVNCSKFNKLFLDWFHNQSEEKFKELKKYSKFMLSDFTTKIIIKDYAGMHLPCIKIIDTTNKLKIVTRVGFGIYINIKEIE